MKMLNIEMYWRQNFVVIVYHESRHKTLKF